MTDEQLLPFWPPPVWLGKAAMPTLRFTETVTIERPNGAADTIIARAYLTDREMWACHGAGRGQLRHRVRFLRHEMYFEVMTKLIEAGCGWAGVRGGAARYEWCNHNLESFNIPVEERRLERLEGPMPHFSAAYYEMPE